LLSGGELGGLVEPYGGDGRVYRCSGEVFVYDLETEEWAELPVCNPQRRAGHALVVVEGVLYSFGGRTAPLPATKPFPSELLRFKYNSTEKFQKREEEGSADEEEER